MNKVLSSAEGSEKKTHTAQMDEWKYASKKQARF
jgi:hypothetical protein